MVIDCHLVQIYHNFSTDFFWFSTKINNIIDTNSYAQLSNWKWVVENLRSSWRPTQHARCHKEIIFFLLNLLRQRQNTELFFYISLCFSQHFTKLFFDLLACLSVLVISFICNSTRLHVLIKLTAFFLVSILSALLSYENWIFVVVQSHFESFFMHLCTHAHAHRIEWNTHILHTY